VTPSLCSSRSRCERAVGGAGEEAPRRDAADAEPGELRDRRRCGHGEHVDRHFDGVDDRRDLSAVAIHGA
jgi:hypothetical protein